MGPGSAATILILLSVLAPILSTLKSIVADSQLSRKASLSPPLSTTLGGAAVSSARLAPATGVGAVHALADASARYQRLRGHQGSEAAAANVQTRRILRNSHVGEHVSRSCRSLNRQFARAPEYVADVQIEVPEVLGAER
jgi:hypothetical protein